MCRESMCEISRRDFLRGTVYFGAALAGVSLAGCLGKKKVETAPPVEKPKVRVGWMKLGCISPYFVAKAEGYWGKQGLDAQLFEFRGGPPIMEAMSAGEIDAGFVGAPPVIAAISRDVPVKYLAGNHHGGMAIVARGKINSIADLKGKKIGSAPPGAISDIQLKATLIDNGFDLKKDVTIVSMGYGDMMAALESGAVDAVCSCASYPSYAMERLSDAKIIALDSMGTLFPGRTAQCCGLVVTNNLLEKRPDVAKKLVEAHIEAINFINQNPLRAAKAIADDLKTSISAEQHALSTQRVTPDLDVPTCQIYAEKMAEIGAIKRIPNMKEYYDPSLWKKV